MANQDSSQYTLRYNEITKSLEVCIGNSWIAVTLTNNVTFPAITAANINSGASTMGQLLTSNGDGTASWLDPA